MVTQKEHSGARPRRSDRKPPQRSGKPPGYGWRANLSGLERPRQWLGVLLVTVSVLIVAALIAALSFG